jgi:hypothetical protein
VLAAFVIIILYFATASKFYFTLNTRHGRGITSITLMLKTMGFMIYIIGGIETIQSKNYLDKKKVLSLYLWTSTFCGHESLMLKTRLIFFLFSQLLVIILLTI